MAAVLTALLGISVYAAVIFCGIMIFKKCAKNKISPVLQFALWFILIARLALPFTAETGFHFVNLPQQENPGITAAAPAAKGGTPAGAAAGETADTGGAMQVQAVNNGAAPRAGHQAAGKERTGQPAAPAAPQPTTVRTLPPAAAAVLGWLAGICAVALVMAVCWGRMCRRIRKGALLPDERIRGIFEACKKELGVKGRIRLRLSAALSTPALTVSLRPVLLLPLDLYREDEAVLRYAVLHELTHYKRGDYAVRFVMNILKAVWWFNPVVWLADRQIVMDMETACDSMVVRRMEKEDKKRYASTILAMFSEEREARYILGMALGSSKQVAEKRIRGIYMKRKTKRGVKLAALVLTGIMGIACFTTACAPAQAADTEQPGAAESPSLEPVGAVSSEAQETEHISRTLDSGYENIKIEIDADVIRPDTDDIPARGYVTREFTQADVDNAIEVLMGGKELYAPIRTKADVREDLENAEPAGERTIAALEEELETAPETETKEPANTTLKRVSSVGEDIGDGILQHSFTVEQDEVHVWADAGNSHDTLDISANSNLWNSNLTFQSGLKAFDAQGAEKQTWYNGIAYEGEARGMGMSRAEAEALATKTAQALDPDMRLAQTRLVPIVNIPEYVEISQEEYEADPEAAQAKMETPRKQADEEAKTAPQVYQFYFAREVGNIPVTYTDTDIYMYTSKTPNIVGDTDVYALYEFMSVTVDDNGIVELNWRAPGEAGDEIREGGLISLEDAVTAMQENLLKTDGMLASAGDMPEDTTIEGTAQISEIRLGYARVMNEDESFTLVPAWDFFGTYLINMNGESMGEANGYGNMNPAHSLFTVNALDGSIIFREGVPYHWQENGGGEAPAQPSAEETEAPADSGAEETGETPVPSAQPSAEEFPVSPELPPAEAE